MNFSEMEKEKKSGLNEIEIPETGIESPEIAETSEGLEKLVQEKFENAKNISATCDMFEIAEDFGAKFGMNSKEITDNLEWIRLGEKMAILSKKSVDLLKKLKTNMGEAIGSSSDRKAKKHLESIDVEITENELGKTSEHEGDQGQNKERVLEKKREKEISNPLIQEARMKRNQILEGRGLLQMPKDEFEKYFSSKNFDIHASLKQVNVGDCYAVAAIHALSCSPHFEMIIRSSMKKLPNGSWEVKIPLLSKDGQTVIITPEDILPQKNRQFMKRNNMGKGIVPDFRMKLSPLKGKEGLQALEAAYIKHKFESVDRLKAEGGHGDEVLLRLGGDNFFQYMIDSSIYNEKKKKWEYPGLNSLPKEDMFYVDNFLENFDPEIHIATVSTKHFDMTTLNGIVTESLGFYKGKDTGKFFVPGHAYSVSKVDSENKIITLANPWNTSNPIKLTFDQFKGTFSRLSSIRVNSAKLLENMENVSKEAA